MSNEVGDVHGQVVQAGHVGRIDLHPAPAPVTALSGLPPATTVFCGRETELATLRDSWPEDGPAIAVAGLAGIGKTELVLHAAHQAIEAGDFPGGVLFVDLQGYDDAHTMSPAQALDNFLRALGVDSHHLPPAEDQRAVLYRSMLSSRPRMLIVLDNASSITQVRPLLPGGRHRVVITSRHTLSGLDEAHHLDLGLLNESEAAELVGDPRLAKLCGRLPLALRIMRALTATDPLTEWATELADTQHRLDLLDDGDSRAVHAAFALSYRALDDEERRLFRLLPLHPTDEFSLEGAAALADRTVQRTRALLRELVRAHLVEPGSDAGWFTFHDLVRLYAEHCRACDPEADLAVNRMMIHYAIKASAASWRRSAQAPFTSREEAFAWFDRTWSVLTDTARIAAEQERPDVLFPLAESLWSYFDIRWPPDRLREICQWALGLARAIGDRRWEAKTQTELGNVHVRTRQFMEGIAHIESSLALHRAVSDEHTLAGVLNDLGSAYRKSGRPIDATVAYAEALSIREAIGYRHGEGQVLNNLGNAARGIGDFAAASEWYDKALALREQIGDRRGKAQTHHNIATNLMYLGNFEEAISRYSVALREHRDLHQPYREAWTLTMMGRALRTVSRRAQAEEAWRSALSILERLGAEREAQEVRALLADI
ncbi:ATP-binding protein [Lentzea sp. NPDC092896]|uniref:ATP-binding protein n=1 Tax=Lentzea sp. NPDC092896 TaxID=3364127 RepID=UPI00382B6D54